MAEFMRQEKVGLFPALKIDVTAEPCVAVASQIDSVSLNGANWAVLLKAYFQKKNSKVNVSYLQFSAQGNDCIISHEDADRGEGDLDLLYFVLENLFENPAKLVELVQEENLDWV